MKIRQCDMQTFSKRCKSKSVACYGIGKEFDRVMRAYASYEWVEHITCLVDGNQKKIGTEYRIREKAISIVSLEYLKKRISSNTIILITCMAYYEIVKCLSEYKEFDNTECYLFHFMFSMPEHHDLVIRQKREQIIPPKIHYCWFGGGELPDLYKRCIESWKKYCPDYEIVEWNESNCDIGETEFTKQAYVCKKYGFVPDYFRLKIIYENGGIYLDTDVELLKNLDDLRYNEAFCGLEFPGEAAFGLGFGACASHPLIKKMMDRYHTMRFLNEDGSINEIGSPFFQSMDLVHCGMSNENRLQIVQGMTIYPIEVLSPQNVYTGTVNISKNTYAWHHFDGSWVDGERLSRKMIREKQAAFLQHMMYENEGINANV